MPLISDAALAEYWKEFEDAQRMFTADLKNFADTYAPLAQDWKKTGADNKALRKAAKKLEPLAEASRDLVKQADQLWKLATRIVDRCDKELAARDNEHWSGREITHARKEADEARHAAVEQLKLVRYFHRQAHWLQERFPEAKLANVLGLVKLVNRKDIEANDWSLTPGRYVGVAPDEVDEDFDFEQTIRDIHTELADLNKEAAGLAAKIQANFEELGV